MVKTLKALAVGVALALVAPALLAGEPCPEECQRRAKASFAFAKAKQTCPVSVVAPMPHEPVRAVCSCGSACECPAGKCPGCEPAIPAAPPARVILYYRRVCDGRGGCYLEPVYGP